MIIKATRLQAWASARVGRRTPPPPPSKIKKCFLVILGAFLLLFLYMGALLLRFSHIWGPFHQVLDMFCYDFALKITKIMINCSHVPARWV